MGAANAEIADVSSTVCGSSVALVKKRRASVVRPVKMSSTHVSVLVPYSGSPSFTGCFKLATEGAVYTHSGSLLCVVEGAVVGRPATRHTIRVQCRVHDMDLPRAGPALMC